MINVGYLTACHDDVALFECRHHSSTQKIDNYYQNASLKSKSMGKLINRIPGLRHMISSLIKSFAIQQAISKPCLVYLISKDSHLAFLFINPPSKLTISLYLFFFIILLFADFFQNHLFLNHSFINTMRVSNDLDPGQDPRSVCHGLGQFLFKRDQQINKSRR